jgi:hypothetical protein
VYVVILTLRSSPFTAFHTPTIHSDEPILCLKNRENRCMTFKSITSLISGQTTQKSPKSVLGRLAF